MKSTKIKVQGLDWPLERYGQIAVEDHCEDGTWAGAAASGNNAGANLAWQDPVDIMIRLPGEIVLTREEFQAAKLKAIKKVWIGSTATNIQGIGQAIEDELFGEEK